MANLTYSEFSIKKKNGKLRKIVNPSPELKRYQRKQIPHLHQHFLDKAGSLENCFHGFLPKRNAVTGARAHIGFKTTIMFDLVAFFDSVTYEHVTDARVLLNKRQQDLLFHKSGYAAQGFPSSPMLANIAAIPFIRELDEWLQHNINHYSLVIYADDVSISFNDEARDTWQMVREYITKLATSYKFAINPNKTRVRFAKYGARRILGLNVTDTDVVSSRKTNRKVRALLHQVQSDTSKGQALGGMKTWQRSLPPKQD